MNILMSGGSGFIGSYFLKRFIDYGASVDIISRIKPTNLKNDEVLIYDFDITKPQNWVLKKKYDLFIHLAGANDIDSRNPFDAIFKTTYGTRNCLELCLKNKIKNFIYFSTLQVYGDNQLISENSNIACNNDYALTHYFAEEYVKMFKNHGIDFIILRPSNVYGNFESKTIDRWSLVPGCFCKDAKTNSKITLMTSGKQKRDFVSLEDVFGFTFHLVNNYEFCRNEVYNLASGDVHSILELAELVKIRYELKFNMKCNLSIKSKLPEHEEKYNVSLDRMKNTGYDLRGSSILQIQETIDHLLES